MKTIFFLTFLLYQTNAITFDGLPQCVNEGDRLEDSSDFDFVEEMTWFEIALGILIIFFTFLCFLPQMFKILKRRDGTGLSPSFLLVLSFNQIFAFINATVTNFPTMHSCIYVGWQLCVPKLLSYFQIGMNIVLCYPIFALFIIFFKDKTSKDFKRSLIYFVSAVCFLVFSIIMIFCLIFLCWRMQ